jgi:hypothetical protein
VSILDFIKIHPEVGVVVSLIGGGLAGAAFTQLVNWWRQPVLRIVFAASDRGCALDTPAAIRDESGNIIAQGQQRNLRVRVDNEGRSTAHGVNLCVTEITFYPSAGTADIFDEEVLDLSLSLSDRTVAFDLGRGAPVTLTYFAAKILGEV